MNVRNNDLNIKVDCVSEHVLLELILNFHCHTLPLK